MNTIDEHIQKDQSEIQSAKAQGDSAKVRHLTDELHSLEAQEKWLSKRMSANSKILQHVKDDITKYDTLESDSFLISEMENKTPVKS